jgi:RNA polymerase sigma-70 factor (sigma-E family)
MRSRNGQAWGESASVDERRRPGARLRGFTMTAGERGSAMTAGEPSDVGERPTSVTETLIADVALGSVQAEWDAGRAVTAIYSEHYRSLVRLAALLVRDVATAEEVVQDSFVAMHGGWHRLRDSEKALSYLRQSVVNRSRSVLRHRVVVDRNAPKPAPDMPSAEHGAITLLERSAVVAALRTLPPRQREALVLRYYGDLSEAQIAGCMGISKGAVKSHTARAMIALRSVLEREA